MLLECSDYFNPPSVYQKPTTRKYLVWSGNEKDHFPLELNTYFQRQNHRWCFRCVQRDNDRWENAGVYVNALYSL